jgi:hypothetical protein
MPIRSDRCEGCGASLQSPRTSIREMASEVACGSLLLAVLIVAGYAFTTVWNARGKSFLIARSGTNRSTSGVFESVQSNRQ